MRKRGKLSASFVRRSTGRDEINAIETKTTQRRVRHGNVPGMHGIERAAEQCDALADALTAALGRAQWSSACAAGSDSSGSESAGRSAVGKRSSASAIA